MWNGRSTVYDAGTGVIPEYRRQGLSNRMFELMMPEFSSRGCQQYLLEVVTTNDKAIALYKGLDFLTTRTLSLLHCEGDMVAREGAGDDFELREIETPDWGSLCTFWDGEPSWQNSTNAVDRSRHNKRFIGAFKGEKCVGYIVYSSPFGRIAQLAVDRDHRRRGIGTRLVKMMIAETAAGQRPQVINIDRSIDSAMTFLKTAALPKRSANLK